MKARLSAALAIAALVFLGILITSRVYRLPLDPPMHRLSQALSQAAAPPAAGDPQRPTDPFAGSPVASEEISVNADGEAVRVKVLKTTFKYPLLRIESVIDKDPLTGAESLRLKTIMVADHVMVKANPGVDHTDFQAMLQRVGATIRRRIPNSDLYLLQFPSAATGTVPDALKALGNEVRTVKYAEPDFVVRSLTVPDDGDFSELWGLHNTGQTGGQADADIDAPEAWEVTRGSRDVIVGVIDSGIAWNHPDIEPAIWRNPGEIVNGIDDDDNGYIDDYWGWDFFNFDNQPFDDSYHGTHVAGTIGATGNNGQGVTGVCWNVSLMPLKFLGDLGVGVTSDATEAVLYATRMGANLTNNSWGGGGYSQALKDAIDAADAAGILFVAAAGNSASDNDQYPFYPNGYSSPNILSVAATDDSDMLASFSNYGVHSVDLSAPGVGILSTMPGGGYAFLSGTSMAAPHVSGACALIWSTRPDLDHHGVKNLLLDSVDRIPSLSGRTLVEGRLNVNNAVSELLALTVSPTGRTESVGLLGGPFSPGSQIFALKNDGVATMSWTAEVSQPWLTLTGPVEGSLAPGHTATVVATVNPTAAGFAAGTYEAKIRFRVGDSRRVTTRDFRLTVHAPFEVSPASGFAGAGEVGGPFGPESGDFLLENPTAAPVAWRASLVHDGPWTPWADLETTEGTLAPGQQSHLVIRWNDFANQLPAGVHSANLVIVIGTGGDTQILPVTLTTGPDHFTELVDHAANDRTYQEYTFTPTADGHSYTVTRADAIPILYTFPAPLTLPDNGSVEVPLTDGKTLAFFGNRYGSVFIGSNGYVTFGAGDSDASGTLDAHFNLPRISGFFRDLNPAAGGSVACLQLSDRVVVGFFNVPEPVVGGGTSFEIEMFTDGRIRLTLLASTANQGLIGLSEGGGVPAGFYESDFSVYPETPPAFDGAIQPAYITGQLGGFAIFRSWRIPFPGQPATIGWRHNGVPLENSDDVHGAHGFLLSLSNLKAPDAGNYDAVLTSYSGQTTISDPAVLFVSPEIIANGSFEQNLDGWHASGNVSVESTAPYTSTDGSKILAFNSGNRPPDGALSQTFACALISPYLLEFDVGVLAYNTSEQRLQVTGGGSFSPVSDIISISGTGGGHVNWLSKSYILNSVDKTHMSFTFRDVSTTTDSVDLLLDHVRVTPLYGLRVSVSPYGLTPQIDVSPPDVDAKGGGIAEFHRLYRKGESVRLTAPAEVSGQPFLKWRGAAYGSGREVTVTMNSGVSMEAVYGPLDPPLIDSASTATATQGFHFQYGISATNRPESYFADPLPDALALSGEIISGVPTTPGTYSINLGATNAGGTGTAMLSLTVLPAPTDFLAEIFDASDMDTAFQSFTFTPDASANRYTVTRSGATVFHTDPAGGQPMPDGRIYLDSGTSIPLFGKFYDSLLIASNGSVALGDGYYPDSEPLLSPGRFMGMPGVAALFSDLVVPKYGSISWKQLADRVAVTFQSLQDRQDLYEPATGSNNFQIELFFDGRIRITLLGVTAKDGIIGLSRGEGVSAAFVESDFSNYPLENGVALTPISDFHSAGPVAGPFSPASKTYVLSNAGPDSLDWTATCGAGWLIASPAGGTLASGASTQMDVTLQPTASSLTAGNYHCDLTVATAAGSIVRRMGLDVSPIPPAIDSSLGAAGRQGFPFNYQITAAHGPTSYAATILPDGLSINPASGLISGTPTGHGEFVVQLSAINDAGTGNALLTMTIDPLPPAVVTLTGDADPGWPRQSEWAYGTPTGSGGSSNGLPDPAAGATGTHVFGVNLGGDYSLTPGGPFYLTAGPFDLSEADQTVLQFRRWLNTDFLPWAGATLEISADGQNWALLWTNGANPVIDTGWQSVRYDISQVADHGSSVFIRWGYQVQAGALAYSGWNIDDIEILANTPLIVTTPIDENDGALGLGSGNSLREVLAAAAAIPGTNDIRFGWSLDGGTINIGTAIVPGGNQLNVDSDVTIDASDLPSKIKITGSGVTRVFEVLAGTHVSFVDLMIQNGNTISSLDSRGGGILNHGNLTLTGCVVRDSTSDFGGGLFNEGTLTLTRSVILGNQAAKHGGGIANTIASTTLTDSIVRGNSSGSSGGGIVCWGAFGEAHVTLNNSEVTNNTAVVAGGGYSGGLGYKMWGNMTATNTTFSGNSAGSRGGAIRMDGLVHLISSTVAGNYCNEPAGEGGGIFNESGFPDILSLENTIVAANTSTNNPDLAGTVTEQTGNNFVGGDPMLAPLNPYGGFTSTMPPLPGSPVIDAAIPLATTPATDQRGAPRPTGPLPDIGAVEAFPFSSLALLDSDHDGIDDRLEPAYGLTVGADDSIQDSDGDGSRDAEEIANMTDPLDPDSSLKITSFSPSPGFDAGTNALFDLSFTSFPGLSYSLEFSQTIDFSGPDLRVQALGPATAYSTGASVQLQPPADFVRVRRNP